MPRLIVTGTGRNGTGFIAATIEAAGIRAGHEAVFGPCQAIGCQPVLWCDYQAEASWLAVPSILRDGTDAAVRIQLRHPLDTIDSLLRLGLFDFADQTHNPYRAAVASAAPEVFAHTDEAARAAHFVTVWPWLAGDWPAYRVEDVPSADFAGLLDWQLPSTAPKVADDINAARAPKPSSWTRDAAREGLRRRLRANVPPGVAGLYRERYQPWYSDAAW